MKQSVSFKRDYVPPLSQDFEALRELGLLQIQKLSGEVWTDFNAHDPGVTILEQLCYALTDVSYRTSFAIEDLLMSKLNRTEAATKNALIAPSKIFSSHPVTIVDVKKQLIDHFDEIQNVWIDAPRERGFANRLRHTKRIEILPKLVFNNSLRNETVGNKTFLKQVRNYLRSIRNIGEDIEEICLLKPHDIAINFELHLEEATNVSNTLVSLFTVLFEYVYNPVQYYNFEEMLEAGYDVATIFSGPKLRKGFVKDDRLKRRKLTLRSEDLQKLFSNVNDVQTAKVNGITSSGTILEDVTIKDDYFFHLLKDDRKNYLADNRFERIYEHMQVFIGNKPFTIVNQQQIDYQFREAWAKKYRGYPIGKSQEDFFYQALIGKDRGVVTYQSIQNHFPIIYGIGKDGIPKKASAERHAQAKQLKGFLSFFEQHLANHLAQINKVDEFFNINFEGAEKQTYFSQELQTAPNIDAVKPSISFKLNPVLYERSFWKRKKLAKASFISLDTDVKVLQQNFTTILLNESFFRQFMEPAVQKDILPVLLRSNHTNRNYLEALMANRVQAFGAHMPDNFWEMTVVSFMVLMTEEDKLFQPNVFSEAFFRHLKKILTAAGCSHKFGTIYAQLKGSKNQDIHALLKFYKTIESRAHGLNFFDRKNRTYDHMLSRFGEQIDPLPWNVSRQLNILPGLKTYQNALLQSKSHFLQQIEWLSSNRIKGESFVREKGENNRNEMMRKPSGLEVVLTAKTGIPLRKTTWTKGKKNKKVFASLIPEFAKKSLSVSETKRDLFKVSSEFEARFRHLRSDETKLQDDIVKPIEMPAAMFGEIKLKSLFKRPLDFANYRVNHSEKFEGKVEVIFQKDTNQWVSLFTSTSLEKAIKNIHNVVRMCRKVNMESEGFYVVDQILLRSFLNESKVGYGFQFLDETGAIFCETSAKKSLASSEEEREENLKAFYENGLDKANYQRVEGKFRLMNCMTDEDSNEVPLVTFMNNEDTLDTIVAKTTSLIKLFAGTGEDNGRLRVKEVEKIRLHGMTNDPSETYGQRKLVYQRVLNNNKSINEDFFDQEVTIVLPNWPARFQDERFNAFFEKLVYERMPSHLSCSILWLNKDEMQTFESVYLPWEHDMALSSASEENSNAMKSTAYKVYKTLIDLKSKI